MASTVSSGCSSPTNISFKTFLNVLRKNVSVIKKFYKPAVEEVCLIMNFDPCFKDFFGTLNLPHIDSFFFFFLPWHGK